LRWVTRLEEMLAGLAKISPREVTSHKDCARGKWYYTLGRDQNGNIPEFIAIEKSHIAFHLKIRAVVDAAQRAGRLAAESGAREAKKRSASIDANLDLLAARVTKDADI
jgi:methyl-accepting chemotaxis protein